LDLDDPGRLAHSGGVEEADVRLVELHDPLSVDLELDVDVHRPPREEDVPLPRLHGEGAVQVEELHTGERIPVPVGEPKEELGAHHALGRGPDPHPEGLHSLREVHLLGEGVSGDPGARPAFCDEDALVTGNSVFRAASRTVHPGTGSSPDWSNEGLSRRFFGSSSFGRAGEGQSSASPRAKSARRHRERAIPCRMIPIVAGDGIPLDSRGGNRL
jgi:hypothetical protein